MKNLVFIFAIATVNFGLYAQNWYQVPSGTTNKLNVITFASSSVGYIGADSAVILKTTNGGATWTALNHTGITPSTWGAHVMDLEFVNENEGYATVSAGGAYKTLDGGLTWARTENPNTSMCFANKIFAHSPTHLFIGGTGCFQGAIIERLKAGVWENMTINSVMWDSGETIEGIDFYDEMNGLIALRSKYVLKTSDAGLTWDTISTGISTGYLTSVLMVDAQLCYAGYDQDGAGFGLLKSSDGGLTWAEDVNSATFFYPAFTSLAKAVNGNIYAGAKPSNTPGGLIFESKDTVNWDYTQVDQAINSLDSYDADVTFAVGDSGYIVVNKPIAQLSTSEYSLDQFTIYPNPVTKQLHIRQHAMTVKRLEMRDQLGRKVKEFDLGSIALLKVDVSDLEAGTYFISGLDADGTKCVRRFVKM